ncbi:SDR family oxidoreductase [Noviherbaspirillum denitrificans]|uniref:Short-chain dehydrogenase n=1 Tax=Noviherbaspirillum denitrificans TaxID=1968433 RepID=A0A254TE17_9BURK|nr:SDR family oxidoreductase [Noviherbaspirillum denitrificans]OWW20775.1 short-chain dehydrogenase [Noviherbaspirillum denitrificans]
MTTGNRKVALVTGAARRLGRFIALALAGRGWDVAVHYGRSADEAMATVRDIEELGRRAAAVQCDLEDEAAVNRLLDDAAGVLGPVSCVINNASLFESDTVANLSLAGLDRHMHANLAAPVILARALHAATADGDQSVVVNLLDQKLFNLNPDFLSYTLSKAGLHTATTVLAQALAPKVRVVGVAPGLTLVSGNQTEEGFAKAHRMTPLGRSSTPEDVASAVCFAAENQSMTGTTLLVDGGQHLIPLQRDVMFVAK